MQISIFHLLTQSSITTNNVYCSHIDNPTKSYQYTIKDCLVARRSHNLIEVDIHIILFPTAESKKIVHSPLQQRIYNSYQGTELPICLSKFSINDTLSTIEIVNNRSSLKRGSLELPFGEELGLHIKYQYVDTFFSSTIQNKGAQKYEFEFELVWNSEYKDTNREKAFFKLFSSEYKNHKDVLLLENKIYYSEEAKSLGIILKLKARNNQHVQSGGQKFTFVPLKEANTSDKSRDSTQETFTKTGPSLQSIPSKKADSDFKLQKIKPKKSRRRDKSLSYVASNKQRKSLIPSTPPVTPTIQDNIHQVTPIEDSIHQITPIEDIIHPVTPIEDIIHPVTPIEDIIHHVTPIEDIIHQVTPLNDDVHHVTPIEDIIHHVTPIEDIIHHVTPIEECIHQVAPIEDIIYQVTPIEDIIHQVTPIEDIIHQVTPIEDIIHQVTPIEDSIHQVTPIEDSIYQVTPLNDDVHHETPIQESIYQVTPSQESIHQEIPTQVTPINDDIHHETPIQESIYQETSSQESIHHEIPIQESIYQETSSQESIYHEIPSQETPINNDIHEYPQRKDDIHEDPPKNSPTESSSHEEESSEYEYKPINFFSTVGGVTMLIQCLITIVLILLPMTYKFISIHRNRRTGLFSRNSKE